jgi:hypothetical protein
MGAVKDLLLAAAEAGQTEEQARALFAICERYHVTYDPDHYKPAFDLPKGYVAGWVGGYGIQKSHPTIYVGCSPEGAISS